MKRFVEKDWVVGLLGGVFAWVVAALTGADAGATYLIALGVVAITVCIMFGPERFRLWREEHRAPAARRRSPR
jgi:hypothetical protein